MFLTRTNTPQIHEVTTRALKDESLGRCAIPDNIEKGLPTTLHHQVSVNWAWTVDLPEPHGGQWGQARGEERVGQWGNFFSDTTDKERQGMKEKLKVLVVDDDRRMVRTICDILKVKGHESIEAYSGEEAVIKAQDEAPDCVLMDIKMPGISGVEALQLISAASPDLPVVLMSAYATSEQEAEAKRQGAYTVLTKPINIQILLTFLSLLRKEESILVVDDDPVFCRTIKDILQEKGYSVETEMDGANVLSRMERNYNLVVVLDLKLGNVDGLEVLKKIRARYPSKPVILVTGYGGEMATIISKGDQIGAYAYLYKPLEIDKLTGIIEDVSRRKKQTLLGETFDEQKMIRG
jgi:DNA-binding NtrC family response regulator